MNKPNKKMAIIAGCASLGILAMAGGAFAFFSASTDPDTETIKVGSVALGDVNVEFDKSPDTSDSFTTDNLIDPVTGALTNLNPGDKIPMEFTVSNTGTKSVEEKTYVYLIFDNNNGKEGPDFSDGSNYISKDEDGNFYTTNYSNFIESITVKQGNTVVAKINADGTAAAGTLGIYKLPPSEGGKIYKAIRFEAGSSILNGVTVPNGADPETEANAVGTSKTYSYTIEFDLRANIHTMNQSLTVKTLTQAIQYRNSSAGEVGTLLTQAEAVYDDAGNFQYGFKAN